MLLAVRSSDGRMRSPGVVLAGLCATRRHTQTQLAIAVGCERLQTRVAKGQFQGGRAETIRGSLNPAEWGSEVNLGNKRGK